MTAWRKTRAIVALAAAYAVAAQAVLLAVGGAVAGVEGFTASLLCSASKAGAAHRTPGGQDPDCPAACAACCCSASVAAPSAVGAAAARERPPAESVAVAPAKIPTWHFNVDRAHRSRAPPLR